jgi:uncharacterized repeat protein (TIGR01451 family)
MRAAALVAVLAVLGACNVILGFERPTPSFIDTAVAMRATESATPGLFTFEITVSNIGDDFADTRVSVQLPLGALFVGGSSSECQTNATMATCTLGLDIGATGRLSLIALPAMGTITATVFPFGGPTRGATLAIGGDDDVEVRPLLDGQGPIIGANRVQKYTFRVRNNAGSPARDVAFNLNASPGFERLSFGGPYWDCTASTCTMAELVTTAFSIEYVARTPATAGPIFVEGTVSSSGVDVMPENNFTRYSQTVDDSADLAIALTATPDPVAPGGALTYMLAIHNSGPSWLPNVTVTNTLPAGTMFINGYGIGWSCAASGNIVTCHRTAPFEIGDQPINMYVTAPTTPGAITTTATISAANPDATPANNTASITTTVQ